MVSFCLPLKARLPLFIWGELVVIDDVGQHELDLSCCTRLA